MHTSVRAKILDPKQGRRHLTSHASCLAVPVPEINQEFRVRVMGEKVDAQLTLTHRY